MTEPAKIIAGDTLDWTESISDYSAADGWTLKYTLINSTTKISLTSIASGNDHKVNVVTATSTNYAAGDYSWQSYVEKDSVIHIVANGFIIIETQLSAKTTFDYRSHAKKTLTLIETAIEAMLANGQSQSISINGRTVQYRTMEELIKAKSNYAWYVKNEEAAEKINAGLETGNKILVRF